MRYFVVHKGSSICDANVSIFLKDLHENMGSRK